VLLGLAGDAHFVWTVLGGSTLIGGVVAVLTSFVDEVPLWGAIWLGIGAFMLAVGALGHWVGQPTATPPIETLAQPEPTEAEPEPAPDTPAMQLDRLLDGLRESYRDAASMRLKIDEVRASGSRANAVAVKKELVDWSFDISLRLMAYDEHILGKWGAVSSISSKPADPDLLRAYLDEAMPLLGDIIQDLSE
jgi:hypothetical protein